jgi:hypothetical protein
MLLNEPIVLEKEFVGFHVFNSKTPFCDPDERSLDPLVTTLALLINAVGN